MSKKLAKILRTEMSASLPMIAKLLESKGRNRDKILAHINEDEAELLRMHGGSGTINPETGLMEFDDGSIGTTSYFGGAGEYTPEVSQYTPAAQQYTPEPAFSQTPAPSYGTDSVSLPTFGAAGAPTITNVPQAPQISGLTTPPPAPQLAPTAAGTDLAETPKQPDQSAIDKLAKYLGVDSKSLLTAGISGLGGILQSRQAAAQGQQAKKELGAMAKPYRERGQELLTSAERGELTPVGQQQLQAMQARLAQGVEARGGVGVQQAQAQINAYRDQLIQSQYDLGLKVLNVADNIAAGAIKTGLQADQYVNELTSNYMNNMVRALYGQAPQTTTTTTTVQ